MATEIIADGSESGTTSSDVIVGAGASLTVGLKNITGDQPCLVNIELYDGATYVRVGKLTRDESALVIAAAGTYRFVRSTGTCGVFSG